MAVLLSPMSESTADLETRARAGDATAFGTLLRLHHSDMRGLVWSMLRDPHATDDVLQSAYEKAFVQIDRFEGRSSFSTWLHSICYRTAIDHLRYEGRRRHEDIAEIRHLSAPNEPMAAIDDRMQLAAMVEALTPDERALLFMQSALGHSYDELAEITGQPRGTLATKLSRLKTRLRMEQQ